MGLRDLFKRKTEEPDRRPPVARGDAARAAPVKRSTPAKRKPPVRMIRVGDKERPAPLSYQHRTSEHLHYLRKPVEDWGEVDLFDYWLDLNHNLPAGISRAKDMPLFDRPRMDLEFEWLWKVLTEARGYRPADVALLLRWGFISGELDRHFERHGMLGHKSMIPGFEEKTEVREGIPVRAFRDPEGECAHAMAQWEFKNLDSIMELMARTFGFPTVLITIRGINPRLGPDLIKHASQFINRERAYLDEIALMRSLHGEVPGACPPDEFFLER
ncbi:hypothetical protein JXA47_17270 [Candidatus Sumerlaeota bacterium]|nr:hypothetical protein [Candidatus Sumerlaeota bacterium]